MEIWINDSQVNFKIEKENHLLDILKSLQHWSDEGFLIITSFRVNDGKTQYLLKDELADVPLSQVKKLEMQMCSSNEHLYQSAKELGGFLDRFRSRVQQTELAESLKALDWVEESLNTFLTVFAFANKESILQAIKAIKIALHRREQDISIIFEQLDLLSACVERLIFKSWIHFLKDAISVLQEEELPAFKKQMQSLIAQLLSLVASIAQKLQTGKDGEAMAILEDVAEAYQVLSRYLERKKVTDLESEGIKGAPY